MDSVLVGNFGKVIRYFVLKIEQLMDSNSMLINLFSLSFTESPCGHFVCKLSLGLVPPG